MSDIKAILTVKDSVTFTLKKTDLTEKRYGEYEQTPERDVPCYIGLKWRIRWYPAGKFAGDSNHLSVFLHMNTAFRMRINFVVGDSSKQTTTNDLVSYGLGWSQYAAHRTLRPLFRNGKLPITCSIEFDVLVPFSTFTASRMGYSCDHVATDFELIMETGKLQVHKSLLSLMSPVFHAMLVYNTVESMSGKVRIKDFDYQTVEAAIDYCYGRALKDTSIDTIVGILRFADKYDIKSVLAQLEPIPLLNLSTETFCAVFHYAYDCSKQDLSAECAKFFKNHENEIKATTEFGDLPLIIVTDLMKAAFGLDTLYDIYRHALINDYGSIIECIELAVVQNIQIEYFFVLVTFAFQLARDKLMEACAAFFNDHRDEIMDMKDFIDLTPEVSHGIVKLAYELRHSVN